MAAGNVVVYLTGIDQTLRQSINWASNTFIVALCSHGYTPNYSSHSDWTTDVAGNELTTSGYASRILQNQSVDPTASASHIAFDADDITFSATATMTAKYAVAYHETTGQLLCYVDLETGTTSGVDATQVVVQWNANGMFRINHSGS